MADFPTSIYDQRTLQNVPGQDFNPDKPTRIYAEDIVQLGDEVTAIEETLGTNPQGSSDNVDGKFNTLETAIYGIESGLGIIDGEILDLQSPLRQESVTTFDPGTIDALDPLTKTYILLSDDLVEVKSVIPAYDGQFIRFVNVGPNDLKIYHNQTSFAGKPLFTPTENNIVVQLYGSIDFVYVASSEIWFPAGHVQIV